MLSQSLIPYRFDCFFFLLFPQGEDISAKQSDSLTVKADGTGITTEASDSHADQAADEQAAGQPQELSQRELGEGGTGTRQRNAPDSLGTNAGEERSGGGTGADDASLPAGGRAAAEGEEEPEEDEQASKPRSQARRGRKAAAEPAEDDGKAEPRSRGRRGRQAKVQPTNFTPPQSESLEEGDTGAEELKAPSRATRGRKAKQQIEEKGERSGPRPRVTRGRKTADQHATAAGGLSCDESHVQAKEESPSSKSADEAGVSLGGPGGERGAGAEEGSADQGLDESSAAEATPGREWSGMSADDEMSIDESTPRATRTRPPAKAAAKNRAKRNKAGAKGGDGTARAESTAEDDTTKALPRARPKRGRKRGAGESIDASSLETERDVGSEAADRLQEKGQAPADTGSADSATGVDAPAESVQKAPPPSVRTARRGRATRGGEASLDSSAAEAAREDGNAVPARGRTRRGRAGPTERQPLPGTGDREQGPLVGEDDEHGEATNGQRAQNRPGKKADLNDEAVVEVAGVETPRTLENADAPTKLVTRRRQRLQEDHKEEAQPQDAESETRDAESAPDSEPAAEKSAPIKRQARKRNLEQLNSGEAATDASRDDAVGATRKRGRKSRKSEPEAEEQVSVEESLGDEQADSTASPGRKSRRVSGQMDANQPTKRTLRKR